MNTMKAAIMARSAAIRGAKQMIFDWHKAAQLIKDRHIENASAGLRSDWEYTGGQILENGKPVMETYTYLSSNWAVPELDLDGDVVECYLTEDNNPNNWNESTIWPDSALEILNSK